MTDQTTPEAIAERLLPQIERLASAFGSDVGVLNVFRAAQKDSARQSLKKIIVAAITAAVEKAVDRVRGEIDADEWRRLSPEARHAVNLLAQEVERLQADLAAAEGRAQEYQTAAEEYERLYADALTTLETAQVAGVAEGRTAERNDTLQTIEANLYLWQQTARVDPMAAHAANVLRVLADSIRARTGKEQPSEH